MKGSCGFPGPNLLWVVLFGAAMWLFFYAMPRFGDDIGYMELFRGWYAERGISDTESGADFSAGFPWRELTGTWTFRYYGDHVRLAMFASTFLLLFPKWLGATLMTGLLLVAFYASLSLAGTDRRRSPLVPLLAALLILVLPWRDGLAELVFQLNYIPATAFVMLLLLWLQRKGKDNGLSYLLAFLFGLFTGWWHEGIALPVGCGLAAVCVSRSNPGGRRTLYAAVGLIVAAGLLFMVPGMRARVGRTPAPHIGAVGLFYFLTAAWPCLLVLVWISVRYVRRGLRRLVNDPLMLFGVVSMTVSLAIGLRSGQFLRAAWWAYFITCVLTVCLLHTAEGSFRDVYNRKNILIWAPLFAVALAQIGTADYMALRIRRIADDQLRAWHAAPGRSRFADVTEYRDIPAICGFLPYSGWHTSIYYESLKFRDPEPETFGGYTSLWGIAPEALRRVTADSGTPLAGGSGIRMKEGYLFMYENDRMSGELSRNDCSVSDWEMSVDYGSGPRPVRVKQISFLSEGDGRRYSYLVPQQGWIDAHFRSIRAICPEMKFMAPDR